MCAEIWCFWPLSASTTSEVKNDHAHVITQGICNKFIEVNFCVGCMVSQPNRPLHRRLPCLLLIRSPKNGLPCTVVDPLGCHFVLYKVGWKLWSWLTSRRESFSTLTLTYMHSITELSHWKKPLLGSRKVIQIKEKAWHLGCSAVKRIRFSYKELCKQTLLG